MSRIFIRNKYFKWYFNIIKNAQTRGAIAVPYVERHHVLPKSLFPKYKNLKKYNWNCAVLTAREHFICHLLLIRMTAGKARNKMIYCIKAMRMDRFGNRSHCAKTYDVYKPLIAAVISENNKGNTKLRGVKKTPTHRQHLSNSVKQSEKHRSARMKNLEKAVVANKGTKRPDYIIAFLKETRKGIPKTEQAKQKMSEAAKQRSKILCSCINCRKQLPTNSLYSHLRFCS